MQFPVFPTHTFFHLNEALVYDLVNLARRQQELCKYKIILADMQQLTNYKLQLQQCCYCHLHYISQTQWHFALRTNGNNLSAGKKNEQKQNV